MQKEKEIKTQRFSKFRDQDCFLGLIFVILGVLGYLYSDIYIYSEDVPGAGVAPDFYPKLLFTILAICGLGLIIEGYKHEEKKPLLIKFDWKILLPTIVVLFGYAILFEKFGFIISTLVFMIVFILLLGERNPVLILSVPIITTLFIYLLFTRAFMIVVP